MVTWIPTDECSWEKQIAQAISRHCRLAGEPIPADEHYQRAVWEVPEGTALDPVDGKPAPQLRVTAGGRTWLLDIDRDGICGCGECGSAPAFTVEPIK
jgi:hypothetical protein